MEWARSRYGTGYDLIIIDRQKRAVCSKRDGWVGLGYLDLCGGWDYFDTSFFVEDV